MYYHHYHGEYRKFKSDYACHGSVSGCRLCYSFYYVLVKELHLKLLLTCFSEKKKKREVSNATDPSSIFQRKNAILLN